MTERLRELLAKATPGPWKWTASKRVSEMNTGRTVTDVRFVNGDADAAYIAACDPDTIRELLDAHDRMAGMLRETLGALVEVYPLIPEGDDWRDSVDDTINAARAALAVPKEETP